MGQSKERYLAAIGEMLQEIMGETCLVTVETVSSNGIWQMGIRVMPIEGLPGMSMVVGIKDMADYGWDIEDAESCAEGIVQMYAENKELLKSHGFTKELVKWEMVKSFIYPLLLSVKDNEESFRKLVHERVLDFVVAYTIRMATDGKEPWVTVRVTESIFGLWDIEKDALYRTAMNNLRNDGFVALDQDAMIHSMYMENMDDVAPADELKTGEKYILTNRYMHYGAAAILDKALLKKLSGGGKLYILPIDVHSVIVIKDDGRIQEKYCNGAVRMMKTPGNGESIRFSDHAYCYEGEKNELRVCREQ